jgi:Ca2+-binding RTX toxin-like protein
MAGPETTWCGGDGSDEMEGGAGDDYLDGGEGADWIEAMAGRDICVGEDLFGCEVIPHLPSAGA